VEEACRRFDLSPLEEAFVISHFVQHTMKESIDLEIEARATQTKP
jgi:hypothetical protein